jgi:hypothetical protein
LQQRVGDKIVERVEFDPEAKILNDDLATFFSIGTETSGPGPVLCA